MGRYLTRGMNIRRTRNPRAILSVFCHPDCFYDYLYLCISKHAYQLRSSRWLLSGLLRCKQMSRLRTLSQFVASCEFSSTVVFWCAVSYNCHFPIPHLKHSLQKLPVNWLLVLQQFFSIRNPNLMLLFLQGGKTIFPSWFIMSMMNSYI